MTVQKEEDEEKKKQLLLEPSFSCGFTAQVSWQETYRNGRHHSKKVQVDHQRKKSCTNCHERGC